MNPHDWMYPVHGLQTHPEPMRGVENALMMTRDWQTHSRLAAVQPHSNKPVWRDTSPPSQNLDGETQDGLHEDLELARKRKELQEINEMILYRKAAIAVKTLQRVNNPAVPGVSHDQQLDLSPRETLRNRVAQILLQRPFSLFSQLQKERSQSSNQSKEHLQQEHHPLKLRVTALRMHGPGASFAPPPKRDEIPDVHQLPLHQRIRSPPEDEKRGFECFVKMLNKGAGTGLLEMVSDLPRRRPTQNVTSPTKEENGSNEGHQNFLGVLTETRGSNKNKTVLDVPPSSPSKTAAARAKSDVEKGFSRFLSILNKGVDIDLLSKIVKDDKEDLTNVPATCVKAKSDRALGSVRQKSDSGSSSPSCKRIVTAESKTNPPCREGILSDAKEAKKTKKGSSSNSSSQSESPQTAKKKKKEEEEERPKLDEKQKQLQSILETLGLDLGVEELSRVGERTEERLYGKKTENNQKRDSTTEQDGQQPSSHRDDRERSRSRERGRCQTQSKAQKRSHRDEEDLFIKNPHSAGRSSSQYTQNADPYDPHSSVTNPYRSYEEGRINLNNLFYVQPEPSVLKDERLHPGSSRDTMLPLSPDLSFSEGQSGLASASRCLTAFQAEENLPLTIISTKDTLTRRTTTRQVSGSETSTLRYLKVIRTKEPKRRSRINSRKKTRRLDQTANQSKPVSKTDSCPLKTPQSPETSQPVEKKLTEEDIKARLREKLQAFNQKSKEVKPLKNIIQPADLLSYELS